MWITKKFKNYFFRGLAVLLPTILTIGIFIWGYTFIQKYISIHINRGLVWLTIFLRNESGEAAIDEWNKFWIDGIGSIAGFAIALVAVCMVGALLASVIGKTLWRMIEKFITRTPFLGQVYPYIKQITDFLFKDERQKQMFSRVVAVEYPHPGVWVIGMVTGEGIKKIADNVKKEMLTILIPTSPTPFTGYVVVVPKERTIELDISIEQALRFIVSGGVINPNSIQADSLIEDKSEN